LLETELVREGLRVWRASGCRPLLGEDGELWPRANGIEPGIVKVVVMVVTVMMMIAGVGETPVELMLSQNVVGLGSG